jgi:hypothetical protein
MTAAERHTSIVSPASHTEHLYNCLHNKDFAAWALKLTAGLNSPNNPQHL